MGRGGEGYYYKKEGKRVLKGNTQNQDWEGRKAKFIGVLNFILPYRESEKGKSKGEGGKEEHKGR